jgi:hypothetical protein
MRRGYRDGAIAFRWKDYRVDGADRWTVILTVRALGRRKPVA